jgi:gamma-glutamyltranspeptidase/glutathione hydrolase
MRILATLAAIAISFLPAFAQRADDPAANAVVGSDTRFHPVVGVSGMVSAEERTAATVGAEILKQGGNAVDAAVATGFALAVTHPQAGNLGGGGFMVIALPKASKTIALDYREMAPKAATRDMFLDASGNVDTGKARFSRSAAGVPGSVAGLVLALEKYGTLPLATVMAPAIKLAEEGFPIPPGLAFALNQARARFDKDPSSVAYFEKPGKEPFRAGDILKQADLAVTLRAIADKGRAGFYEGDTAAKIVAEMKDGGLITLDDLKSYRVVERTPVRGTYNGYDIVSMPPPSSGGAHVIQILNILEGYDLVSSGPNSADTLHKLIEAARRAYADRAKYMGDPDFVKVPLDGIVSKAYAAKLRAGIDLSNASRSEDIQAGEPPREGEQTTHYSVMDKDGNTVSATTTLNFFFGSGYSVDGAGFLLNNEMDDFSAKPGVANAYGLLGDEANAIQPGKRPLSSMAPTIVLKDGLPVLATGSPGGSTIITVVVQHLLNVLTFGMNIAEATAEPRIHHQWMPDNVIAERGVPLDTLRALENRGFKIAKTAQGAFQYRILGRVNAVMRKDGILLGAADQRANDSAAVGF